MSWILGIFAGLTLSTMIRAPEDETERIRRSVRSSYQDLALKQKRLVNLRTFYIEQADVQTSGKQTNAYCSKVERMKQLYLFVQRVHDHDAAQYMFI